jgi:transcription initiation factor TFIIE subunit beta
MALQEQLERFNKQQQRAQATLVKTAVRAAPSSKPPPPHPAPSSSIANRKPSPSLQYEQQVPLAQRFSFNSDKEKLQQIAIIRKSPVGAQIKRVIDLLLEVRQENPCCFFFSLFGVKYGS